MKNYLKIFAIIFFLQSLFISDSFSQKLHIPNSSEIQISLNKLNTLGSVLYIAAHPDDENTSVLAYLSLGKKYRTGYLALTRGDGGQNLIGFEKGSEIGMIRTQELLEARRIDGAEQYFTRAIDFGYSKTAEETLEFWGEEEILADIVWVIRKFRPDVILTRFSPESYGGHGHHTASTMLTLEAFKDAADPTKFPEQLKYVEPWQTKRVLWNNWRGASSNSPNIIKVDIGKYDPLLGKSFTEIASESRTMHKSQGFGSSGRRGTRYDYFQLLDGEPATSDLFDGIDTCWSRVPGSRNAEQVIKSIIERFDPADPSKSVPDLIGVYNEFSSLGKNYWIDHKKKELLELIKNCSGLWMEAMADDYSGYPGESVNLTNTVVNRSDIPFSIESISISGQSYGSGSNGILGNNNPFSNKTSFRIPDNYETTQPYWLKNKSSFGRFNIQDQNLIGLAEDPASVNVVYVLKYQNTRLEYTIPVLYRWTDRVHGEMYRSFEVRPPITVDFEDKVSIFPNGASRDIVVKLNSHAGNISGRVSLKGPGNWKIEPATIAFTFENKYEEQQVVFKASPPASQAEAVFTANVQINGKTYQNALKEISHPHIKRLVYLPESKIKLVKLDIKKFTGTVGYIMGAGDEIPDALSVLGYDVVLLDDEKLNSSDFSQFDAIITGIRAYNTRQRLKYVQPKLMQYVENGGVLLVQYNVSRGLVTKNIGPYPFTIGSDRVTLENADVTPLDPEHNLMNFPNKITAKDFEGWVQERGLYFSTQWNDNYQPVLSSHDPGEPDRIGGMIYAKYGKGTFIYSGYSWFRQLPAGVPGAYRLFVNLISAGRDGN